jgi:proline dehydrogenase
MPLRRILLYLSNHRSLRHWAETSSIARKLSSRFVAGDSLEHALDVCRRIQREGIHTTLDYLGENVRSMAEAEACRNMYLRMLYALHGAGQDANVSLKLTQFGLDLSEEGCAANVEQLVRAAADIDGFVRIDMEASAYTTRTLQLVKHLHGRFPACGTVIQAYLRRSAADIEELIGQNVPVRLCKGAYLEPADVAFLAKADVDRNYLALACRLLESGTPTAIATHDEAMIGRIERFVANRGIRKDRFEFEMLYGIRRDLQKRLVQDGYQLRLYVPFGEAWYPYFMRRLAERPANVLFILRNLLRS